MQDVYAVLREKELAIECIRREIEALRVVCQLVAGEEEESNGDALRITESSTEPAEQTAVVSTADEKKVAFSESPSTIPGCGPKRNGKREWKKRAAAVQAVRAGRIADISETSA